MHFISIHVEQCSTLNALSVFLIQRAEALHERIKKSSKELQFCCSKPQMKRLIGISGLSILFTLLSVNLS
jgi:anti-anti-sigma regulatory factor